jgi:hypothetical protein
MVALMLAQQAMPGQEAVLIPERVIRPATEIELPQIQPQESATGVPQHAKLCSAAAVMVQRRRA